MQKYEELVDSGYGQRGLESSSTAAAAARDSIHSMSGPSILLPQALPEPWDMLKLTLSSHLRECQARSGVGLVAWGWWMVVMLPLCCAKEVLAFANLIPG